MSELKDYMKLISDATINETIRELKRNGLLVSHTENSFKKTEKLLLNYNKFKQLIQYKIEQIENIKAEGLIKNSKSFIKISNGNGINMLNENEKVDAKIEEIENSISKLNYYIKLIDHAIDKVKTNPYSDIIQLKYFDGLTYEDISLHMDCDISTIKRNKNKLINDIKIYIFPEDSIMEYFN